MPRPGSGPLSGILRGLQSFMQARQFYQQMETTDLQQELSRAQLEQIGWQRGQRETAQERFDRELRERAATEAQEVGFIPGRSEAQTKADIYGMGEKADWLGARPTGPAPAGQTTWTNQLGQSSLVDDPTYGVIPSWEADQIFKDNPGMENEYTKEPVPGAGKNMVKIVPKRGGSRSDDPSMIFGRNVRAYKVLNEQIDNVISDFNNLRQTEFDVASRADPEKYEGMVPITIQRTDLHPNTSREIQEEFDKRRGNISHATIKSYIDTDVAMLGTESRPSEHRGWLIALSNSDPEAFKDMQVVVRGLLTSRMGELVEKYLVSQKKKYAGLEYEPYQTIQNERIAATDQIMHTGPRR